VEEEHQRLFLFYHCNDHIVGDIFRRFQFFELPLRKANRNVRARVPALG
jgi:hypothetical protein